MEFSTGCIIDKSYEQNNYDFSILKQSIQMAGIFPTKYKIDGYKILNQQNIGSCVCHAIAQNRYITEKQQLKKDTDYSVKWIYYNRKITDYQGEGMVTEQAILNLMSDGVPEYADYTGNETYEKKPIDFEEIKKTLLPKAIPHKISAYYQIKTTDLREQINDIKLAIMNFGAVVAAIDVYQSFYDCGKTGGYIKDFDGSEKNYGGHAISLIGWTDRGEWIVANSWGESWGDKGLCYIPFTCNIWQQFFVIVDNYVEKENGKIKYAVILTNTVSANDNLIKTYNKILGTSYNFRILETNNKKYVSIGDYYNTREEAKKYKDSCDLKDVATVTPFYSQKEEIYYVYMNITLNEAWVDATIKNFKATTDFEREFTLLKIKVENAYYISLKSFKTNEEAESYTKLLEVEKTGYSEIISISQQ